MSFFNTTGLIGAELRDAIQAAKLQEDAVLAIFRASPKPLAPSAVWHRCQLAGKAWPLTSVRRAITNLTDRHLLQRCEHKRSGLYGRPEFCWETAA